MDWTQQAITGKTTERKQQRMAINRDRDAAWRAFGVAVEARRIGLGLERKDIEERTEGVIKGGWLSEMERGHGSDKTSYALLTRLAFVLGWTPEDLARETGMLDEDPTP